MPFGYRWAQREDMEWVSDHPDWFMTIDDGTALPGLAVKWDCMIEFGMDHDHDPEECESRMLAVGYHNVQNRDRDLSEEDESAIQDLLEN